jgi:hypothetical protein
LTKEFDVTGQPTLDLAHTTDTNAQLAIIRGENGQDAIRLA